MEASHIMEQAQVYASAWSLVGGGFDAGGMLGAAEHEKLCLAKMVAALEAERDAAIRLAAEAEHKLKGAEAAARMVMVTLDAVTAERDTYRTRLRSLREAYGYVENGSSDTIHIGQYDATRD